jgi:AcrR family transcriptional regulator
VRQSVLDATLAVLADGGVDALTVADVAARAGVHETSIRRRWHTRANLICDALLNYSAQQLPIPDTGSLREDLTIFVTEAAAYDATPLGRALLHATVMPTTDAAFAQARESFWRTRHGLAKAMIDRAIARGEIRDTISSQIVLEAIIAPLHFRTLITQQQLDDHFLREIVDLVLSGILKPASLTESSKR